MFRRSRAWAGLGLALALVACSGDDDGLEPNNITVVTPTRPLGYVAGVLEDVTTGQPVQGARVVVFGGGVMGEAQSDASGAFSVGPIPAGASSLVRVSAEGYVGFAVPDVTVDDAAGDFPTDNAAVFLGPLGLVPSTGAVDVDVVGPSGQPLAMAAVALSARPVYFDRSRRADEQVFTAQSDAQGRASFTGLPALGRLPPALRSGARFDVTVAPFDVDGDGAADLAGATVSLDGSDLFAGSRRRLIVLEPIDRDQPFEIVASNIRGLADGRSGPTVVSAMEGVRLLFNRPVDISGVSVDVVDESGEDRVAASPAAGPIEGSVVVSLSSPAPGQEYNLDVTVPDATRGARVRVRRPFFIDDGPSQAVSVRGRFQDRDQTGSWGTGNDALVLRTSVPLGRRRSASYRAELWVELDLDASGTIGDATGELPVAASDYPTPLLVTAAEPTPGNGAGRSGYTTYLAPRSIRLASPLEDSSAVVNFEVRFPAERNGGDPVTTAAGTMAPPSFTGSATLVGAS
jgi:hypothetical protein